MSNNELRHDMSILVRALTENSRAVIATMKQWWTVENLQDRWALGREATIAVLRERGAYEPGVGKPIRVPIRKVLEIDRFLENPAGLCRAPRGDGAPGSGSPPNRRGRCVPPPCLLDDRAGPAARDVGDVEV
jgi:hypothetical protein